MVTCWAVPTTVGEHSCYASPGLCLQGPKKKRAGEKETFYCSIKGQGGQQLSRDKTISICPASGSG